MVMPVTRPRAAISWSGGKDCCLALLRAADIYDVRAMLTMFGEDGTRSRSHGLTPDVIRAQAARLNLPVYIGQCSWQTYTDQYVSLLANLEQHDITHVIFGDIMGESHREWNEQVCAHYGLTAVMPLWGEPTLALAQDFIARGGDARFVTVRPPLDETWLGQQFDASALARLQAAGADPCGELGEYHSVVANCSAFSAPLTLIEGARVMSNGCWAIDFQC